ncbi:MAG: Lpg1974 family pore-forming outer membrane protein [Planctomycetota bacterium]
MRSLFIRLSCSVPTVVGLFAASSADAQAVPAAAPPANDIVQTGAWAVPLGAPVAVAQTPAPEDLAPAVPDVDPSFQNDPAPTDPGFLAPESVIGDPGLVDPYVASPSYPAGSFPPAYGCDTCTDGGFSGSASAAYGPTAPQAIYHGYGGGGRSGWTTGFSFVFLRPRFQSNDAFVTSNFLPGPVVQTNNVELAHDLGFGWRVWVENVGADDFGFRVGYFDFDEPSNVQSRAIPAGVIVTGPAFPTFSGNTGFNSAVLGSDNAAAVGNLSLYALDFEVVQRIRRNRWLFNIGGGLRHAAFEQDYEAVLTDGGVVEASSTASRRFDGIGPTIFAEVRRPVGLTGLSLLASLRGSLLYGEHKDGFTTFVGGPAGGTTEVASFNNDDLIPVGELQLGGEWSFWLTRCSVFSLALAWEAQIWEGAGSNVAREGDLGLDGFNLTLGLEW